MGRNKLRATNGEADFARTCGVNRAMRNVAMTRLNTVYNKFPRY